MNNHGPSVDSMACPGLLPQLTAILTGGTEGLVAITQTDPKVGESYDVADGRIAGLELRVRPRSETGALP